MFRAPVSEFESQGSGRTQHSSPAAVRRLWAEAEINLPTTLAESVKNDPKPKIGEHKVARYLVGPSGGQIEDTRWWTFAFWAHRKAFSRKRL